MNKITKSKKIFLYLLFLCYWPVEKGSINLPSYLYWGDKTRYFDFITIFYLLIIMAAFLFFICMIKQMLSKDKKNKILIIDILVLIFFIYRLISLILFNRFSVIRFISAELCVLILYYLLRFEEKESIIQIIFSAGLINSIMVLIQLFLYGSKFSLNIFEMIRYVRFSGAFRDPVVLSIFLVCCIDILLYKIERERKFLYYIYFTLFIIGIIFTGSRGALVILGLILFIYIGKYIKKFINTGRINIYLIICILGITILCLVNIEKLNIFFQDYDKYILNSETSKYSTESRIINIEVGVELFKDNMLIGVGTNNYSYYSGYKYGNYTGNPHNIYIQLLSENGIIGFILFLLLVCHIFKLIITRRDYLNLEFLCIWLLGGFYIGLLSCIEGRAMFIIICYISSCVNKNDSIIKHNELSREEEKYEENSSIIDR